MHESLLEPNEDECRGVAFELVLHMHLWNFNFEREGRVVFNISCFVFTLRSKSICTSVQVSYVVMLGSTS